MSRFNKRWRVNKLPRPGLQLRLIASVVGLAAVGLFLQFLLLAARLPGAVRAIDPALGDEIPGVLLATLAVSLLVVIPLVFVCGALITFRVAGPVYRMEEYLAEVARGGALEPCSLRKDDELQDLCQRMNAAVAALRERRVEERLPERMAG